MRRHSRFVLVCRAGPGGTVSCSKKETAPPQEAPSVNLSESDIFKQPVPSQEKLSHIPQSSL